MTEFVKYATLGVGTGATLRAVELGSLPSKDWGYHAKMAAMYGLPITFLAVMWTHGGLLSQVTRKGWVAVAGGTYLSGALWAHHMTDMRLKDLITLRIPGDKTEAASLMLLFGTLLFWTPVILGMQAVQNE